MTIKLAVLAALLASASLASPPAAPLASVSEHPPPALVCDAVEIARGLTRWQAAWEIAWNYCTCLPNPGPDPDWVASCADDMGHQIAYGDESTLICGYMIVDEVHVWTHDVFNDCLVETYACGGLPEKCWELTGWEL